jgi:integrase
LRVKDVDFDDGLIFVRAGKGDKDRATLLAKSVYPGLRDHLLRMKALHDKELASGMGEVWLPDAFCGMRSKRFAQRWLAAEQAGIEIHAFLDVLIRPSNRQVPVYTGKIRVPSSGFRSSGSSGCRLTVPAE